MQTLIAEFTVAEIEAHIAQRALEMAIVTKAALDSHIQSCENSSRMLRESMTTRFDSLNDEVQATRAIIGRAAWSVMAVGGTIIMGLIGIVGALLHNHGNF